MKDEMLCYDLGTGEHMHNIFTLVGDMYMSPNGGGGVHCCGGHRDRQDGEDA